MSVRDTFNTFKANMQKYEQEKQINTAPKPFVFVLMPFHPDFDDVYKLGIKAACEEAGAYCERVDEQDYDGNMVERIYNQIAKADILVADMSGKNANVFYEVGYAHGIGKQPILCVNDSKDIPFDFKQYPHIVYNKISTLKDQLISKITYRIHHPKQSSISTEPNYEYYIEGIKLDETKTSSLEIKKVYFSSRIRIKVNINNPNNKLKETKVKVGLLAKFPFTRNGELVSDIEHEIIQLNEKEILYQGYDIEEIYPKGWSTVDFILELDAEELKKKSIYNIPLEMAIQEYSPAGNRSLPFNIIFIEEIDVESDLF